MSNRTASNYELVKKNGLGSHILWFLLAFAVGLTLRLVLLNTMVFTQNELVLVNQALQISRRLSGATSMVPVYSGLTGWLFFFFGPANMLSRLLPALVGTTLVLLPCLWEEQLGRKTAIILSFAFAFDPTYLLFSRTIHGGIFAIAGLIWAYTWLKKNKPVMAGVSLAIAFLSGSTFGSFLLIFGLTFLVVKLIRPNLAQGLFTFQMKGGKNTWFGFAAGFVVSCILILTSFLLDLSGLGGSASGIIDFARNFVQPFEKQIYHSIYLMISHSYLPISLFIIGFIRSRSTEKRDWYRIGGLSVIIAMVLSILISRESYEILLWPVFVCWVGGAVWLGEWQIKLNESGLLTVLLIGFILAILTYLSVNLGRLSDLPLGTPQFWNIILMITAGIILLVSAWWLVKFGWATENGNQVFLLTLLCFLAITSLSSSTRSLSSSQQARSLEYLDNQVVLPNNDIEAISSEFSLTGRTLEQFGGFSVIDLPEEYSWYFRSFAIERNQPGSSMILTRTSTIPGQSEEFRGMNVVIERSIDWQKESLATYLQTLMGKPPTFEDQKGVLWVRTNLFTGASQ